MKQCNNKGKLNPYSFISPSNPDSNLLTAAAPHLFFQVPCSVITDDVSSMQEIIIINKLNQLQISTNMFPFVLFVNKLREESMPPRVQMATLFSVASGSKYVYGSFSCLFLSLMSALSFSRFSWKVIISCRGTSSVKSFSGY